MSQSMAQSTSAFLLFPREIREHVYSFLPSTGLLPLSATCQQLHAETQPLFYARHIISIGYREVEGWMTSDMYEGAFARLRKMSSTARQSVYRAQIYDPHGYDYNGSFALFREILVFLDTNLDITELTIIHSLEKKPYTGELDCEYGRAQSFNPMGSCHLLNRSKHLYQRKLPTSSPCDRRHMPTCRTLVLYGTTHPKSGGCCWYDHCFNLGRYITAGSPLQNLELWVPRSDFEKRKSITTLSKGHNPCWHVRYWGDELNKVQIKGLKSFKVMAYNSEGWILKQIQPIEPLRVERLQEVLDEITVELPTHLAQDVD